MEKLLALSIGYFIGCIQVAYLLTKYVAKIDIREQGSGNAGATNVVRTLGKKYGATVLLLDIFKGVLACVIAGVLLGNGFENINYLGDISNMAGDNYIIPMYAGLGAVLGHNFPFALQFKGGKGAATTLGVFIYVNWILAVFIFISGIIQAKFTGYVSLSSIIWLTLVTGFLYLLGYNQEVVFVSTLLSILTLYQHRGNIKRLLNGTERKIGKSKK